jgi:hypothetical protein
MVLSRNGLDDREFILPGDFSGKLHRKAFPAFKFVSTAN